MFRNKPFWFSLAILSAYLLLGYFAVPPLLHPRLEQIAARQIGLSVQFESLKFDPITWSAELRNLRLLSEDQDRWSGLTFMAEEVHVRFNFWRLAPAISELIVKAPELVVDGDHPLMSAGRYPFFDQWQQWQARPIGSADGMPVRVQNWQVEGGRVLLRKGQALQAEKVLLDEVEVHVGKAAASGLRPYQMTFSTTMSTSDGAAGLEAGVRIQGEVTSGAGTRKGDYQLELDILPDEAATTPWPADRAKSGLGEPTSLALEGGFSATAQSDRLQIEMHDGRISANEATATCVMEGLLCAVLSPLQGSVNASLTAATDGIHLLKADAELGAFALDASLARGRLQLSKQLPITSARLKWTAPASQASEGQPAEETEAFASASDFEVEMESADGDRYSIQGQWQATIPERNSAMAAEHLNTHFAVTGRHDVQGQIQLQSPLVEDDGITRSRFALELENSPASLAQGFVDEQLSGKATGKFAIAGLQMSASGSIDAATLEVVETIKLVNLQFRADEMAVSGAETFPSDGQEPTAPRLLAWLQNAQGDVVLRTSALQVQLAETLKPGDVLRVPVIDLIKSFREQPLPALAMQLGLAEVELSEIRFEAGAASLEASSSATVKALAQALLQRPGLGLEWAGVFDPLVDLKALQTEQIRTHIALAMAADLSFQSGSVPPDFSDRIVHSVIDEFARRRLPAKVLASFAEHFGAADVDQGVIPEGDVAAYYSNLFELLVDYAEIPQGALTTLARYRAQAVADGLEEEGVVAEQWQLNAEPQTVEARLDGIPLRLNMEPRSR